MLISGFTVMVAMAGRYVTGNATFQSFATGTIFVVAAAMIGSLTVLPALLSKFGDKVDRLFSEHLADAEGSAATVVVDLREVTFLD